MAGGEAGDVDELVAAARERAHGELAAYAVDGRDSGGAPPLTPTIRDAEGAFAAAYGAGPAVFLVRPDGYVGFRSAGLDRDGLLAALGRVFA